MLETSQAARQHVRAVTHLGEGSRAADQGLGNALRQTLRLHQRLTAGGQLLTDILGLAQNEEGDRTEHDQTKSQQHGERALVLLCRPAPQQGHRDQPGLLGNFIVVGHEQIAGIVIRLRIGSQAGSRQFGGFLVGHGGQVAFIIGFFLEQSLESIKRGHVNTFQQKTSEKRSV
ncbi:hypothetical protein FQZ97_806860 [compost metagenome]